jgi:O-antigen/teichoic acid export membrane protein
VAVLGVQFALLALVALGFAALYDAYLGFLHGQIVQVTDPQVQTALLAVVGRYGWLVVGVVLLLLLTGILYDVLMAYLSSFFKQRAWNGVALAAGLLPPLLASGAILAGWDVLGVLLAMAAAPTIATLLVSWQVWQVWREQRQSSTPAHTPTVESHEFHELAQIRVNSWNSWLPPGFVRYCAAIYLFTATDFLASAGFAVFFAETLVDAALLTAGVSIVRMVLGYLYTPMVGVQVPLFTRVRAGEGGTLLGAYQSTMRLQVLLLVPGGVGLVLLAEPIFALLTPKYVAAAALVWVLAPCLFLECLLTTAHNALIVYERLRAVVVSRLLTLASVPLVLALSPLLGIAGAALAFGLARVLAGLWVTASGSKLLGLHWPWRFTLRVLLAAGLMALLVAGLAGQIASPQPTNTPMTVRLALLPLLLGVAALGGLAFLAALRLTGGLDPADRELLARMKLPATKWMLRLL